jgi:hypothetical protein
VRQATKLLKAAFPNVAFFGEIWIYSRQDEKLSQDNVMPILPLKLEVISQQKYTAAITLGEFG